MTFKVIIPARYDSSRLPGKPLIEIAGIPMIIHVARKARLSGAEEVIVATDDRRIQDEVEKHNFEAVLTSKHHLSGSDRILEVATSKSWDSETIIINVQGDEPMMDPQLINELHEQMIKTKATFITAATKFDHFDNFSNPNNVKVVINNLSNALYFSRSMIPNANTFNDEIFDANNSFHHLGIYGYRLSTLKEFCNLKKSNLEIIERLEQLRALDNGITIKVFLYNGKPFKGVDTLEDLIEIKKLFSS